ncbi:urease accessory protein UreD [Epibacterium sp. Ofav1-8]|uniref:urease accessory protein UreD n=1 Tax=Epibacterium sp. Ofav1-8 TaxID=2917735 RepID=UPI001EF6CA90|nr:urease accessory protein UreD [Epibacterium sp. Ofav1-8]MCG7624218.1 urease accessory protein UreD [Epibacterium sp. Ofav1-8]
MALPRPDWDKSNREDTPLEPTRWRHFGERAINHITDITARVPALADVAAIAQPRAVGRARLSAKRRGDGQVALDHLHQSGALKLLFPQGRPPLEAVLVNIAGGITGGDRFAIDAAAGPDSQLTLTTQAAERAYRAQPGQSGQMTTHLSVAARACLNWLPQETILFQRSDFTRSLQADLAEDARLLLVEPLVFGRAAMGEALTSARFRDHIQIRRAGQLIYRDAIHLQGDLAAQLSRPGVAGVLSARCSAMATLLLAAPDAEATLGGLRAHLPDGGDALGGASLLAPDLLHMRLLAVDSFVLRQSLLPLLDRLTEGGLPRCWRL